MVILYINIQSYLRYFDSRSSRRAGVSGALLVVALIAGGPGLTVAVGQDEDRFAERIAPILEDNCYACHGYGVNKGGVALDVFDTSEQRLGDPELWLAVLKNVRAGVMPPAGEPRPSDEERELLEGWIKFEALGIDPDDPDPGRVTVRRLNRIEYRNTIRDLLGVDYDTAGEFPPDDAGHGFDNIGDVLTISPLLLEKYIEAAQAIIARVVPTVPRVVAEQAVSGQRFRGPAGTDERGGRRLRGPGPGGFGERGGGPLVLSYYDPVTATAEAEVEHDGRYQVVLDLSANERYVDNVFDYNRCRLVFKLDGQVVLDQEFSRQGGQSYRFEFDQDWQAGAHELAFEVEPLTPDEEQVRSLSLRVNSVTIRGPMGLEHGVRPPDYERFFPGEVPEAPEARREYARELLWGFASKAYRRPPDEATVDRLADLAEAIASQEEQTFEAGVAQAMAAVLASPRFLFREERLEPDSKDRYPRIDEYALASRLSYFLWSTMPDDELIGLAERGELRANLDGQLARMLDDRRSEEFIRHFTGQWLQARDIESVPINAGAVIGRERVPDPEDERRRERFRELRRLPPEVLNEAERKELEEIRGTFFGSFRRFQEFELNGELRRAMRQETERTFAYILREDRSLLELLDSDYTFLNERLARHYGIEGVEGDQMRRVDLPPDSPRGGILTQGTVLAVTSNPDRTSPVKRGLFLLENILGTPPAPPPPDIPSLEEAGRAIEGRVPTLRETLALHREQPLCSSCHNRMDPLGLALENFNALGLYREAERGVPIDASGTLITGESFDSVRGLKRILAEERRRDFYHCVSEKMLTYALGRGLEAYDIHAVDTLVDRLESSGGRASELILGIVESTLFQRGRKPAAPGPEIAEAAVAGRRNSE